jgi:hypothetical protein
MDADDELSVRVRIPQGEDLEDLDTDVYCMSVPGPLVECTVDTLQAVLAQWRDDAGNSPEDDHWGPILAAVGYVLGGLLHTQTTHHSLRGARRLVGQIAHFCEVWSTQSQLDALRGDPQTDYIVEALLRLHEEAERRRKERMRQHDERRRKERTEPKQRTAAEHEPAADRDAGWEF